MAQPPAKKQKIGSISETEPAAPKAPIVFFTPDLAPDTRLAVFNQEFHVHSVYLKLHSAFFRKFLNSPDKAFSTIVPDRNAGAVGAPSLNSSAVSDSTEHFTFGSGSQSRSGVPLTGFKYDWTSKVDDEAKWHLVCKSFKNEPYNLSAFKGTLVERTISIFEKLLCAFYNQPYILTTYKDLLEIVEMADYYRALPMISRTLDGAIFKSPEFVHDIEFHSLQLFPIAAKLRNELLFKECLIWIVNPYYKPEFVGLSDPHLRMIARCAYGEISTKVAETMKQFWTLVGEDKANGWARDFDRILLKDLRDWDPYMHLPNFIVRAGLQTVQYHDWPEATGLLANNLKLCRQNYRAGISGCGDDNDHNLSDCFLSAEISDEDLPWDPKEKDW